MSPWSGKKSSETLSLAKPLELLIRLKQWCIETLCELNPVPVQMAEAVVPPHCHPVLDSFCSLQEE